MEDMSIISFSDALAAEKKLADMSSPETDRMIGVRIRTIIALSAVKKLTGVA